MIVWNVLFSVLFWKVTPNESRSCFTSRDLLDTFPQIKHEQSWTNTNRKTILIEPQKAWLDRNNIKNIFGHYFISGDILSDINFYLSDISLNVSTWNLFRFHSPQLIACIRYSNPVVSRDYSNQGSMDGSHLGTNMKDSLRIGIAAADPSVQMAY